MPSSSSSDSDSQAVSAKLDAIAHASDGSHHKRRHGPDKDAVAVIWVRLLFVVVLCLSAGLVGTLAFVVVSGNEQEDFENSVSHSNRLFGN